MKGVIFFVVFAVILHGGCKKLDGPTGQITITGKLVTDCSLSPLAGYKLRFVGVDGGVSGNNYTELGNTTTDAQGRFSITVDNVQAENNQMYYMPTDNVGDGQLIVDRYRWNGQTESGKTYDWGYVFKNSAVETKINARLHVNTARFGANDSLYIGLGKIFSKGFFPVPSLASISFTYGSFLGIPSNSYAVDYLRWAKTRREYDSIATKSVTVANPQGIDLLPVKIISCQLTDTSDVFIK